MRVQLVFFSKVLSNFFKRVGRKYKLPPFPSQMSNDAFFTNTQYNKLHNKKELAAIIWET